MFSLHNPFLWNSLSVRHWPPAALFPDIYDFRDKKIKVICQLGNVADRIGRLTIQKQLGLVLTVSYHEKSYYSTTTMSPRQGSESRSPSSKTLIFDIFAYFDHVIYIFWHFWLDNRIHRPKLPLGTKFGLDLVTQWKFQNFRYENQSNLSSKFLNFLKLNKICSDFVPKGNLGRWLRISSQKCQKV